MIIPRKLKTWVYFLKHKSEAFEVFKQFKFMVEKKSGHYIKILRIDRGREFTTNNFLSFCKTNGIKRQFTTSYTPQQNGIAKRKNRTIMEVAKSMMKAKHLPNEYWAEVVACGVYILNCSPQRVSRIKYHRKHGVIKSIMFLI